MKKINAHNTMGRRQNTFISVLWFDIKPKWKGIRRAREKERAEAHTQCWTERRSDVKTDGKLELKYLSDRRAPVLRSTKNQRDHSYTSGSRQHMPRRSLYDVHSSIRSLPIELIFSRVDSSLRDWNASMRVFRPSTFRCCFVHTRASRHTSLSTINSSIGGVDAQR